jgi:hypothetical protein
MTNRRVPGWQGDDAPVVPSRRVEELASGVLRMSFFDTGRQIAVMTAVTSAAEALPPAELEKVAKLLAEGLPDRTPVREVRVVFLFPDAATAHAATLEGVGASAWVIDEKTGDHARVRP